MQHLSGFNSGRYDLNVIKQLLIPYLLKPSKQDDTDDEAAADEIQFVIKRQNTFMCLSTNKLKFVDICNYLAPVLSRFCPPGRNRAAEILSARAAEIPFAPSFSPMGRNCLVVRVHTALFYALAVDGVLSSVTPFFTLL